MGTPTWAAYAISCGEKWKNPDRIKMAANRIRPASVTRALPMPVLSSTEYSMRWHQLNAAMKLKLSYSPYETLLRIPETKRRVTRK